MPGVVEVAVNEVDQSNLCKGGGSLQSSPRWKYSRWGGTAKEWIIKYNMKSKKHFTVDQLHGEVVTNDND